MTSRSIHLSVSVAGMLKQSDRHLEGMLSHDDGELLTAEESRQWLREQQVAGIEVIPACSSEECPDFDPINGCPGHVQEKQ